VFVLYTLRLYLFLGRLGEVARACATHRCAGVDISTDPPKFHTPSIGSAFLGRRPPSLTASARRPFPYDPTTAESLKLCCTRLLQYPGPGSCIAPFCIRTNILPTLQTVIHHHFLFLLPFCSLLVRSLSDIRYSIFDTVSISYPVPFSPRPPSTVS